MQRLLLLVALLAVAAPPAWAAPRKGRKAAQPAPAPAPSPAADAAPPEVIPEQVNPEELGSPEAPVPVKQVGLSGQTAGEGLQCPEAQEPVRKGVILRMGPGVNFGVFQLAEEDHCFPRIKTYVDGAWIMVEVSQGKAGWFQKSTPPLELGEPPPLPAGGVLFEVVLTEDVVFHREPSLLSAVTGQGMREETMEVRAVSADGLLFLVARDGTSAGWVLKTMTRNTLDLEAAPGGSKPWAPPPQAVSRLPEGSPDALYREAMTPPSTPEPTTDDGPLAGVVAGAVGASAATPEAEDPNESLYARGEMPAAKPLEWKKLVGIRPLDARPVGRGLVVGAGLAPTFFFQRFESNAFNDPLANYRVESGTAGVAADAEYHAGLGLILGARAQFHGFAYTDYIPPQLRGLPEPIGNPNRPEGITLPGCPYPLPSGPLRAICPIPSGIGMLQLHAGWRIFGSENMDVGLRLAYTSDFMVWGKPSTREPFSDLWYHGVRPSTAATFRPFGGKFGALKGEMGMGAGIVMPMILRPNQSCTPGNPLGCPPEPRNIFESTYKLDPEKGTMRRVGYARPPFYAGLDLRAGYLFELPFVQVEAAVQCMVRYYAVFYTAREGFSKRNRCCDRGYYDRATNLDVYVGPMVMGRLAM